MNPPAATAGPAGPLAVLSEIASRLAEGGEIVATVTDVIQRLHAAVDASEVSLWLHADGNLRRSVIAGSGSLTVDVVQSTLDDPAQFPRIRGCSQVLT